MSKEAYGDFTIKFSYDREPTEEEITKINREKDIRKKKELIKLFSRAFSLYQGHYSEAYGEELFAYIRSQLINQKGVSLGVIIRGHHSCVEI